MYIADAHAWLWYLSEDDRLGDKAEEVFESADNGDEVIVLPGIAVAESVYVTESHGYDIEMQEIVQDLKYSTNYRLKPLNHGIISELVQDDRELSIHDKLIVLTAEQLDADIISRDKEIDSHSEQKVIW